MTARSIALLAFVVAACDGPSSGAPDALALAIDAPPVDAASLNDARLDAPDDAAPPPDPLAALQAMPGLCNAEEWCWRFPTPTGNRWMRVWAERADNIWLLAERGTVLQWNGLRWIDHRPPPLPGDTARMPGAIHGRGPDNVWLVFGSAVEHWDGATWTIIDSGPTTVAQYFRSVWVAPTGDVFTTGAAGVKRSQNGGPFESVLAEAHTGTVWGTAADDVYVTVAGRVVHYDGTTFEIVYAAPDVLLTGYQGTSADVWASGPDNALVHWDGATWTPITTGLAAIDPIFVAGYRGPDDVWWFTRSSANQVRLLHWNGTAIAVTPVDNSALGDLCCATWNWVDILDGRWWIVGSDGAVSTLASDGVVAPIREPAFYGTELWGSSDEDMYFAQGAHLRHWDGATLTTLASPLRGLSGGLALTGTAGAGIGGANELFAVGSYVDPGPYEYVYVGYHFDGATWTSAELSRYPANPMVPAGPEHARLISVHALGAGEAMIAGTNGRLLRYQDGAWHPVTTGVTTDLYAAWGPNADHAWITGRQGTLLVWSRASPDVATVDGTLPATTDDLAAIHGVGDELWIANANTSPTTRVRRHSAAGWTVHDTHVTVSKLVAITPGNVVATSFTAGRVSRWNGDAFILEDPGASSVMFAAFALPGGHTWLTGGSGLVWHP